MISTNSFNRSIDLLNRSLSVAELRRQVIANNVANAETPNFKRSEVNFEAELARALISESAAPSIGITSHVRHIPFDQPKDYTAVVPRIALDYLTTVKNNGNNVDMEREMNDAVKNQMMYELTSSVMNHQFRMVNIVLS